MAYPTFSPQSSTNVSILPVTSSMTTLLSFKNAGSFPFSVYTDDQYFLSGCIEQVSYTYKVLGGDVLDIEVVEGNVFSSFQNACLEYSYIVNLHQAKSSMQSMLGAQTASFTNEGQMVSGSSLAGKHIETLFPRFSLAYSRKVGKGLVLNAGSGGDITMHSGAIQLQDGVQDYDIQAIISSSYPLTNPDNKRVVINRVFYNSPRTMWRFFGFFGGLNVLGNMTSYGMYSDDSCFDIVPVWQHKLQAMQFEDSMYTRTSHYSYELYNNKIRVFPIPTTEAMTYFPNVWFQYYVPLEPWEVDGDTTVNGVNSLNNLPYENIPFQSISSIGKHWIRRYALALIKETLGLIRGKMGNSIPIPGQAVSLNAADLLSQAKEEKDLLKKELQDILNELTYAKVAETTAKIAQETANLRKNVPLLPKVG